VVSQYSYGHWVGPRCTHWDGRISQVVNRAGHEIKNKGGKKYTRIMIIVCSSLMQSSADSLCHGKMLANTKNSGG